ncbi:CBM35 domain-containing protein [Herbidospora yilanensis]|uniref:CBM35 domain-containing protein n=1 Tax=Herbidospora yilanensis TaxID=354426 RepID=UPI0007831816|nr:CBM35 domain-containing protein [Herbidospora yilanensis]
MTTALALLVTGLTALPPAHAEEPAATRLLVDLGERTGAFRGAASGSLYGLSDEGVPSDNTLEPLRLTTVNQKPPAGAQHPNGDALSVAPSFFRNGGQYIQINVQDMFAQWTYENAGGVTPCNQVCFDVYMQKLAWVVDQVSNSPYADRIVYVPFNEPDGIWYGTSTGNAAQYQTRINALLAHWKAAVQYIRAHHPGARVMGTNDAVFRARNYGDFLTYARDNDVLPDFTSWHQLDSTGLNPLNGNYFRTNYQTYRNLEQARGIPPIPININEYGGNRDLTVPGQLIQYVAMLEEAKVDAGGKAYWTAAGLLGGDVVETNKPGGGWWFYKMYADMAGSDTVKVTPPAATTIDKLEAIAAIDDERRQARIIAGGGTATDFDVVVDNIDEDLFGGQVNVTLSATTWSGQNSDAPPPVVLLDTDLTPEDGSLTIPVRGLGFTGDGGANVDLMAAYEIVLSPGGQGSRQSVEQPWRASYEAELATVTAGTVQTFGTPANWNAAATSGTRHVGNLTQATSAVTFNVEAPAAGAYKLGILYGNQTGQASQQVLTVNGAQARLVDYQATLNFQWRTRKDVVIQLQEGANQITLAKSHPELGTAVGQATLDRIDLEPARTAPVTRDYEAERSQTKGEVAYAYDQPQQSGAGHLTLGDGGEAMFTVYAEEDGYYDLDFRHHGTGEPGAVTATVELDRRPVAGAVLRAGSGDGAFWRSDRHRLFLSAGVNRVTVEPAGGTPVDLDRVSVTRATSGSQPVRVIEAESAVTGGTAVVASHGYASGGQYVGQIGQGPQNRLTLQVDVDVAGDYMFVVSYANDERKTGHVYNADIISRPIDIAVNDAASTRYWFKNTWSWGNWWDRGVPVTLKAGTNTITLYNDPANGAKATGCPAPCIAELDSPWAPNLDRFAIAPIKVDDLAPSVTISGVEDGERYGDSRDLEIGWAADDAESGVKTVAATLDGQPFEEGMLVLYELPLGEHTLVVTATDNAGNQAAATVTFTTGTSTDDISALIGRFLNAGKLTAGGAAKLEDKISKVMVSEDKGRERDKKKIVKKLERFVDAVDDPKIVSNAEVKATLLRDAEALIAENGGTA